MKPIIENCMHVKSLILEEIQLLKGSIYGSFSCGCFVKTSPLYRYIGGVDAELPVPFFNVINGGGEYADFGIDIQEFLGTPAGAPSFRQGMESIVKVDHILNRLLSKSGYAISVEDEGAFSTQLKSSKEALGYLIQAIAKAGYTPSEFEGKQLNKPFP